MAFQPNLSKKSGWMEANKALQPAWQHSRKCLLVCGQGTKCARDVRLMLQLFQVFAYILETRDKTFFPLPLGRGS
jgi:hypothetical protein